MTDYDLIYCYGALTCISAYLERTEFLAMQALSKWMYERGVVRVQQRYKLAKDLHWFADPTNVKYKQTLFVYDPRKGTCSTVSNKKYDFYDRITIQVKDELFSIGCADLAVTKYYLEMHQAPTRRKKLAKVGGSRCCDVACTFRDRYIFLTGGVDRCLNTSA